ncbi:alkyl hydroperoxide reductase subunit F [Marinomonas mediterranea]|jgi:alkyl hydroperoxide reductase, F subunit|uniref:Alkyl hydroperoxide reductase subunit F n=1 Tax=Marinomonas mediterranea (strain ATCC 700492 / JCM 21426 / NBRC 103028 / MMB-1) TaxID=717774 RepID=F2JWV3_MARM1|nr:alkyl hydroperoxide reductase subunit F [Marinomonas mediterranea]ADZ92970.1 alkyl hydroperoxide reductase, F subunit [Marinomonas mediterranea MMB-1]WCN10884.1 alkyl hydroperoxide reductase subunit F [Marinomonas mediterranea]WCN14945.1 alkyl hydroperoxide reductase subunit F [Marinomonas mediterranea]WCN18989.1 alkyl hydroperoxide reductase subunit F [Marinomonas mediterranea MMB-1]
MLDSNIKQQLDTYLKNIINPIEITVSTNGTAKAEELLDLARDITSLNEKISLSVDETPTGRAPLMAIGPKGEKARVQFAGIPMGHEFTSLVLALLQAGGHPAKESAETIEQAKSLSNKLNFEIYISLTCQNCPEVVQALNLFAVLNPNVTTTMIDGALFQDEVNERNIMAVPSVYLNGELFGQGRMSLDEILNKVDTGASDKQAAALSEKAPYDVLVVGGGPAGASAAIYSARKGIRTGVVADRFGGQVADTMAIENFISVKETEGPKLVANLEQHVLDYDVDLMKTQKAVRIEKNELIEVELENGAVLKSKSVILATGARWREMNVPGENEYKGKGVAYCPHCDGPLFKGKKTAVIGGGNSGIEAAIDLAGIVEHVTVLEFGDQLRADDVLVKKAESLSNVTIIKEAMTTEVIGDGQRVIGLKYTDRKSGESHLVDVAGIFVQIGLVPNSEFLKDSLELTDRGEIVIDNRGQTSMPGVFAAGDVTTQAYKQIIISMGAGATAALGAFDHLIRS